MMIHYVVLLSSRKVSKLTELDFAVLNFTNGLNEKLFLFKQAIVIFVFKCK